MEGNQTIPSGRGGYREGSGRKAGTHSNGAILTGRELGNRIATLQRVGAIATTSSKVMHALGDAEYWLHLVSELERTEEWGLLVDVMKFHQQMRDGRPAQQINVTSMNVSFSAAEIARARSVVRELIGQPRVVDAIVGEVTGVAQEVTEPVPSSNGVAQVVTSEQKANIMLRGGQGPKKDG